MRGRPKTIPYRTLIIVTEGFYRGYTGIITDVTYGEDLETPKNYTVEFIDKRYEGTKTIAAYDIKPAGFIANIKYARLLHKGEMY